MRKELLYTTPLYDFFLVGVRKDSDSSLISIRDDLNFMFPGPHCVAFPAVSVPPMKSCGYLNCRTTTMSFVEKPNFLSGAGCCS